MGGRESEGSLTSDFKHGWVDVGNGDMDVMVAVLDMRMLEHAEGNVTGASGDVEDSLQLALGVCGAGV